MPSPYQRKTAGAVGKVWEVRRIADRACNCGPDAERKMLAGSGTRTHTLLRAADFESEREVSNGAASRLISGPQLVE
jgi:hypothetical protein